MRICGGFYARTCCFFPWCGFQIRIRKFQVVCTNRRTSLWNQWDVDFNQILMRILTKFWCGSGFHTVSVPNPVSEAVFFLFLFFILNIYIYIFFFNLKTTRETVLCEHDPTATHAAASELQSRLLICNETRDKKKDNRSESHKMGLSLPFLTQN